jgi:endo-1,4-beta-xylanase
MQHSSRRAYLKYVGVAAASIAVGYALRDMADRYVPIPGSPVTVTKTTIRAETVACPASLRAAAEASGLLVGAAVLSRHLADSRYAGTLAGEFNFLTPEYEMKWEAIHPSANRWNFDPADTLVRFASEHQMKVKGHALVWHDSLPVWVNANMSTDELHQATQEHIHTLVGHYRGQIDAWDVVNEAVDDEGSLRRSLFLDKLGERYIAEAFQLAHEADPDALLIYNDYGAEGLGGKSDRVYELLKKLVTDRVPIHGVGLQMHINAAAADYPKPEDIAANIRRLTALGLKVDISEMDVRIRDVPVDLSERLEIQRRIYHDLDPIRKVNLSRQLLDVLTSL